jgi:hypothetical protein
MKIIPTNDLVGNTSECLIPACQTESRILLRQQEVELSEPACRKRITLPRKQERGVLAQVQE